MQKYLMVLFTVLFLSGCKGSSFTSECKQAHEKLFKCIEENLDVDNVDASLDTCGTNYTIDVVASFQKLPEGHSFQKLPEGQRKEVKNVFGDKKLSETLKAEEDNAKSKCGSKETEREKGLCELRMGIDIMTKEICKAPAKPEKPKK